MVLAVIRKLFLCNFAIGLVRYICSFLGKYSIFTNKRKNSIPKNDITSGLTSIKIQGNEEDVNIIDWNQWDEDDAKKQPEEEGNLEDKMFEDMEPVIDKAKMIYVKKTIQSPSRETPFVMPGHCNQYNGFQNVNLDPKYQVEAELGDLGDEGSDCGWDEDIDEKFISKETENIIQTNKALERERRIKEQKQKKLEREVRKAQKKPGGICVKLN